MTSDAEARLHAHVAAILARGGIPNRSKPDLAEELYGHLAQRCQEYIERGFADLDAADHAISDFGAANGIGGELARTYHSRLWASTIGVLLPAIAPTSMRPAAVGWLRFILGLVTVLTAIGLAGVAAMTPIRALGTSISLLVGLAGLVLAFQAIGRGQRWALVYSVAVTVVLFVEGFEQVVASPPGTFTVPLGSILAVGVLIAVRTGWQHLQAFVASSARVNRTLGLALGLSLLAPLAVPRMLAAVPDPSQATADDLELLLSMTCDRGDVDIPDGPKRIDVKRATLVIDARWNRTDLLPYGLAAIVTRPDDADTSGIRFLDVSGPDWLFWDWDGEPTIVDTSSGAVAGRWGSTSPSVGLLPQDIAGSFTVAIDEEAISPGHTIRTTWHLVQGPDGEVPWPRVEVAYAHLDRFLLMGSVGCGELAEGGQVPIPLPVPQPTTNGLPF